MTEKMYIANVFDLRINFTKYSASGRHKFRNQRQIEPDRSSLCLTPCLKANSGIVWDCTSIRQRKLGFKTFSILNELSIRYTNES
jgi:hypothetical protein